MHKPLFSIVTISLNVADSLRQTIESVNGQTYPRIEHIFIDGGSRDGSVALMKHLSRRAPQWISEPDSGIADAFNKGTRRVSGEYVCYLNAGDEFVSGNVLEHVADEIIRHPVTSPTVFYGHFISVNGGIERLHFTSAARKDFAWDNPINHQSAFIPAELARANPYDERLKLGMDYDFWLRIAPMAKFQRLPFAVARFEIGGRSSSPPWEVHGLVMHRVLWHMNQGSRIEFWDIIALLGRALRFKLYVFIRTALGSRLSLAIRAARSRRQEHSHQGTRRIA